MTPLFSPQIEVHPSSQEAGRILAERIATAIRNRTEEGQEYVLGLATGSTPLPLYRELIRLHREEGLSFRKVRTFNLDEYYGLHPDDPNSYHYFMRDALFDAIDLPSEQWHIPLGTIAREMVDAHCADYEAAIEAAGGLDLQILGIGRTGHIGFNEPPSQGDSVTRLVTLDAVTREDAAPAFGGLEKVPHEAITMGVGTILKAREIIIMAWGESKAEIVNQALNTPPTPNLPASFLRSHPKVTVVLDQAASITTA